MEGKREVTKRRKFRKGNVKLQDKITIEKRVMMLKKKKAYKAKKKGAREGKKEGTTKGRGEFR